MVIVGERGFGVVGGVVSVVVSSFKPLTSIVAQAFHALLTPEAW